jgi:hypothetical protein
MKNYVVALISFFDNEIKQFCIEAESPFDAVKKSKVEFLLSDEYKQSEIDFQNSENYPTDLDGLDDMFANSEMDFSIIEVGSFLNN